jgi:hypothetical protein
MPMTEGFKAYNDKSEPEFDKVIISNNGLADLALFKLDPEPKQLYPDGHPALADTGKKDDRTPASKGRVSQPAQDTSTVDDDGRITPFGMGK